jgi:molybdopterin converting factor small subunit
MATIHLRATLRELAGNQAEHTAEGTTVAAVLTDLERQQPALRGFIRDEQGQVRPHLKVFVDGDVAGLETATAPGARVSVLPAISGGTDTVELLVGTRKGLITLRGPRDGELEVAGRALSGRAVDYAVHDSRTGTYFAACNDMHHGPRIWRSATPIEGFEPTAGPVFPEDAGATVERVWVITPGEEPGEVWAGVAPAALFRSTDDGASYELVRSLWDQPSRERWTPGAGGLMVHTICPWPGDPDRLLIGISAGGVWITDDHAATWRMGNGGIVARYLPADYEPTTEFCIHHAERSPVEPARLYLQFHGGVYRSDDGGESWQSIADGLPSDFGFVVVTDPRDAGRAWVVPLVADVDRVPVDGRLRVYQTDDGGGTWQARTAGLPQHDAYQLTFRQAFCHDGGEPLGLWFGCQSGELFGSADAGATWRCAARNLPPILSVRPGATSP